MSPQDQVVQIATAHWASKFLYTAVELKLADCLADGPKTADEVAQKMGLHAPSLYRFLRTLASMGLFTEDAEHRFSVTALGQTLRTGVPGSVRATVIVMAGKLLNLGLDNLVYSLQTGKTGFENATGLPLFDWLAKHPEEASLFGETMVGFHGAEPAAVAAAYDFSGLGTIVDVGGGTGNLLTTILGKHAGPRGVLYDLPHVQDDARKLIESRGLADRVRVETGSFFENIPAGGDAYVLSHVIHDWNEEQCLTILGNCRRAMKAGGRLLLVEMVLPAGDIPHPGKMLDMIMLVAPGGQERTEAEYGALLQKAGLRLTRVVPTASAVSIVEAMVQ